MNLTLLLSEYLFYVIMIFAALFLIAFLITHVFGEIVDAPPSANNTELNEILNDTSKRIDDYLKNMQELLGNTTK